MIRHAIPLVSLLIGCAAAGSAAQDKPDPAAQPHEHVMKTPADLVWVDAPPGLPPGAKVALLEGDPAKEGFFALRLKLPAGYRVAPHFHPTTERLTIIEGTFLLGSGDTFDEAALKSWPAGSYLSMPMGMHHYAMAKEDVVIQLATLGPWGITYLNPADDPRTKPAK